MLRAEERDDVAVDAGAVPIPKDVLREWAVTLTKYKKWGMMTQNVVEGMEQIAASIRSYLGEKP
jgi:hypothetical protein